MTNLILLTILAVLLFGASAVEGFIGGIFSIVGIILVVVLLFAGTGWIFSSYKTNKDFRDGVWLFVWLGSMWYLFHVKMDAMAYTLLLVVPVIYLFNRMQEVSNKVQEDVKLNGGKRVIHKYANVVGWSMLRLTLISVGVFFTVGVVTYMGLYFLQK